MVRREKPRRASDDSTSWANPLRGQQGQDSLITARTLQQAVVREAEAFFAYGERRVGCAHKIYGLRAIEPLLKHIDLVDINYLIAQARREVSCRGGRTCSNVPGSTRAVSGGCASGIGRSRCRSSSSRVRSSTMISQIKMASCCAGCFQSSKRASTER